MKCHIELVYDADCPNVEEARAALRQACAQAAVSAVWVEWDRKAPGSPAYVRGYGSPTILVNGRDVAGAPPGEGADCCRVYPDGEGGFRRVPPGAQIAAALRACVREPEPHDDLLKRNSRWLLWRVPLVALILGGFVEGVTRMFLWAPALLVAGTACVVNARRCGRLHCYVTGPLYLVAAVASVLAGTQLVTVPWSWIAVWVVGGTILAYVPEWLRGKYVVGPQLESNSKA
jgi:hypothetical protein